MKEMDMLRNLSLYYLFIKLSLKRAFENAEQIKYERNMMARRQKRGLL